jgi:hypothetical protein
MITVLPNGVSELNEIPDITIYPNPTTGNLTIKSSKFITYTKVNLSVYDLPGRKVFSSVMQQEEYSLLLDLNPGVYFFEFEVSQVKATRKVIVR